MRSRLFNSFPRENFEILKNEKIVNFNHKFAIKKIRFRSNF